MTRDEAMRAVVEAAREVEAWGPDHSVHEDDLDENVSNWKSLHVALDRLDAIPEEPGLPAICEHCGEVKAWNGEAWVGHCHEAPAPEQKTVRVRIMVGVDPDGQWSAAGSTLQSEWAHSPECCINDDLRPDGDGIAVIHYIEADVPVPERPQPQTIEGEVSHG